MRQFCSFAPFNAPASFGGVDKRLRHTFCDAPLLRVISRNPSSDERFCSVLCVSNSGST